MSVYLAQVSILEREWDDPLLTFLASLYTTLQVFAAGSDIVDAHRQAREALGPIPGVKLWETWVIVIFAVAPFMAIGFILSFFDSLTTHMRLLLGSLRPTHVFADLNKHTILLATSIRRHYAQEKRSVTMIFTGIGRYDGDVSRELLDDARAIGAILYKGDVTTLPLRWWSWKRYLSIYILGTDTAANLSSVVRLDKGGNLRRRSETDIYVAYDKHSEAALLARLSDQLRIRRIDSCSMAVHEWLWRPAQEGGPAAGINVLYGAAPEGNDRHVHALILGLGDYGTEILRALSWFCQMDTNSGHYLLDIDAIELNETICKRFAAKYPHLLGARDGRSDDSKQRQDAISSIRLHSGVDAWSDDVPDIYLGVTPPTFVVVAVGSDTENLDLAIHLRSEFVRHGWKASFLVINRKTRSEQEALHAGLHFSTRDTNHCPIEFLGALDDVYSWETLIRSDLEWHALVCHMDWARREKSEWNRELRRFWCDRYCYGSSIAVPIHWRARRQLNVDGARKPASERTPQERDRLRRLEHARWCAYLRSEGIEFGPTKDLLVAHTHPLLVPFDDLSLADRVKDENDSIDALERFERELACGDQTTERFPHLEEFVRDAARHLDSERKMARR